jgi:hypothetical protein
MPLKTDKRANRIEHNKLESWESPNCPTGELEAIFKTAEQVRAVEHAPAVSLTHFIVAMFLNTQPYRAKEIIALLQKIQTEWEVNIGRR